MPPVVDDLGLFEQPAAAPPPRPPNVVDDAKLLEAAPAQQPQATLNVIDDAGLNAPPPEQPQPSMLDPLRQAGGLLARVTEGPQGLADVASTVAQHPREVGALAARVAPAIAGAALGGAPGGALGGMGGELLAQTIEQRPHYSPGEALVGAAGGALALPEALTAGRGLAAVTGIRALEGAGFSAADEAAREAARGEPLSGARIAGAGLMGAPIGATAGGLLHALQAGHVNVVDDAHVIEPAAPVTENLPPEQFGGGPREGSRTVFPETSPAETNPQPREGPQPIRPEQQAPGPEVPPANAEPPPPPPGVDVAARPANIVDNAKIMPEPAVARSPDQGAASPEAINRLQAQRSETFERVDTRSGKVQPMPATVDRIDQMQAGPFDVVRRIKADGTVEPVSIGERVTAFKRMQALAAAPAKARTAAAPPAEPPLPRLEADQHVYRVPLAEIDVNPEQFQTRRAYGAGGASGQLSHVEPGQIHDPSLGNLVTWRDPADGRLKLVDGHNRYDLLQRAGVPDARVIEIQAANPAEARTQGAMMNMRGGTFNAVDIATVMRDAEITPAHLRALGIDVGRGVARDGAALAELHPALFGMAARGEMPLSRAATIGRELGGSPEAQAQQLALVQMLAKRRGELTDAEVAETIRQTRMAPVTTETQHGLFGAEQMTSSLAVERAQAITGVSGELAKDRRLFGFVGKAERATRLGEEGMTVNPERAQAIATSSAQVGEIFGRLANRQGPVSDLVNAAAQAIAAGHPVAKAVDDILPQVRDAVRAELAPGGQGVAGAAGEGAAGASGNAGTERNLFDTLRNERGAVRLGDLFGGRKRPEQAAPPEQPQPEARPRGSLINEAALRRQPSGAELPPGQHRAVLLYGPDDRPLIQTGAMSAHDPDQLAPTFSRSLDTRIAEMDQHLAELERNRIEYARRGVVPVKQTYAQADALHEDLRAYAERNGMSPQDVIASLRRRGEGVNAAGIELLNRLNVEASVNARAAAARAISEPSPANRNAAAQAVLQLLGTQAQRAGALAEQGRGLQIAGHPRGVEANTMRALRVLEQGAGGADKVDQMIDLLAKIDPNDTMAVNQFVRAAIPAGARSKLYEVWINALLSGPVTHVVNSMSNTTNQGLRIAERFPTAAIDLTRATFTGTPRERFFGEGVADLFGTVRGIPEAVRAGLRSFETEIPSEGGSKFLDPGSVGQAIKGPTGRVVRLPSRFLLAADEFFKALGARGELNARAYRTAAREGLQGHARLERMAEIVANPELVKGLPEDLLTAARYWTFQQQLGEAGQAVVNLRDKVPGLSIIIPFIRTPLNIAKFGLERSPASLGWIAAKAAKGELSGGALSEELARAGVGMAIAAGVGMLAAQGLITGGGPRDPRERATWRAANEPYSVKVGSRWVSYGRIEPLGSTIGLIADAIHIFDMVEQEDFARKAATAMATSLGVNLSNKTFLRGISDLMNAVSDPDRYGERWVQSLLGTAVPTGVAQVARAVDTTVRKPRTLGQVFESRIPGETANVSPIRDLWGEPVRRQGFFDGQGRVAQFAEQLVSPIGTRTPYSDPASLEVARLHVQPSAPQHSLELQKHREPLTDQEYEQYAQDRGRLAKQLVTQTVTASQYKRYNDDQKREAIQHAFTIAGERARSEFRGDVIARMRAHAK